MQLMRIDTHAEIEQLKAKIQEAEKNLGIIRADLKETGDFLRRWRRMLRMADGTTAKPSKKRKEQKNANAI